MGRSSKKGPFVDAPLYEKVKKMMVEKEKKPIVTWSRRSQIIPEMIGMTFLVHNGRKHMAVLASEAMVGHRLGEFAPTRIFKGHRGRAEKEAAEAAAAAAAAAAAVPGAAAPGAAAGAAPGAPAAPGAKGAAAPAAGAKGAAGPAAPAAGAKPAAGGGKPPEKKG